MLNDKSITNTQCFKFKHLIFKFDLTFEFCHLIFFNL